MLKKHLVRLPLIVLFVALISLVVTAVFTSAAGFAQPGGVGDAPVSDDADSPTSSPSGATDQPSPAAPTQQPSAPEPSATPDAPDQDIEARVELYDAEDHALQDGAVSSDQELIASATIRDPGLTQLLGDEGINEQTVLELEVGLANETVQTVTYAFDDLEPRLDDNNRPVTDTYWIDPATADSNDWIESLPEDANGIITLTATYDRNGTLEEPVTIADEAAFLDTTAPTINGLKYVTPEEAQHDVFMEDYLVADGPRYLELTVADEPTADDLELTPERIEDLREQFGGLWKVTEVTAAHDADELEVRTVTEGKTYRILLDDSIEYSLDDINIEVTDTVDNRDSYNAQKHNAELNAATGKLPSTIAIDAPDGHWYTQVLVDNGQEELSGQGLIMNHEAPKFIVESNKPFFPRLYAHGARQNDTPGLSFEQSYGDHRIGVTILCEEEPQETAEGTYRLECAPPDQADEVLEGAYRLDETKVDDRTDVQWSSIAGYVEVLDFTLDMTAPEVSVTKQPQQNDDNVVDALTGEDTDYEPYHHRSLLLGKIDQNVMYELAIRDLFPAQHAGREADAKGDQRGTAGLNAETVRIQLPRPTNLDGAPIGEPDVLRPEINDNGEVHLELSSEGVYDLAEVKISATDHAGNTVDQVTLASVLDDSAPELVVVRATNDSAKAEVAVTPAEGAPAATGESMFRGDVDVTFTINDRWFPIYRALNKNADVSELLKLRYNYPDVAQAVDLELDLEKFQKAGRHAWVYTDIELPEADYSDKPLEAHYEVIWNYSGLNPWAAESRTSGKKTFWIDYTSPNITGASIVDSDNFRVVKDLPQGHIDIGNYAGEPLLVSPQGDSVRYRVTVQDVFGEKHPAADHTRKEHSPLGTAGLDETSIEVNIPKATDLNGHFISDETVNHPQLTERGTFWIELSEEGLYDLSKVTLSATDHAGNELERTSLYDALKHHNDGESDGVPDHKFTVVNHDESSPKADLTVTNADGTPSPNGAAMFRGDVDITFTIQDRWFPLYRALTDDVDSLLKMHYDFTEDDQSHEVALELTAEKFELDDKNTWVYTETHLPRANASDKPLEARYRVKWDYPGLNPLMDSSKGSETFWVDYTKPVIADATVNMMESYWLVEKLPNQHIHHNNYAGEPLLVSPQGDTVKYDLKIQDLFPEAHPAHASSPGKKHSHLGTSGLDEPTVQFRVPQRTDLTGEQLGSAEIITPKVQSDGSFSIELSGEGLYDLAHVTVSATDQAGNKLGSISLYQALLTDRTPHHKFVIVNRDESQITADLTITKAAGVPSSKDNDYYYRGDINTELTVTDRWFPIYLAHHETVDRVVTLRHNTSPGTSEKSQRTHVALDPAKFVATDKYEWVYRDMALPRAPGSSQPLEAQYALSWNYSGLNTHRDHADTSGHQVFVVDYTGPKLGDLGFSDLSDVQGDWIIADTAYNVTLSDVHDPVAGVDTDSVGFHRFEDNDWDKPVSRVGFDQGVSDLEEHPMPSPTFVGSDAYAGSISFDLTGHSQRLFLNRTVIGLTDKAGNPVNTGLLNRYEPTQLELRPNEDDILEGPKGIVIASATPSLEVRYDHDKARNGHYYKDERTATITVTDANFDVLKELDEFATIMTAAVDDSERTVSSGDFSNPSKDRQTWVADFEFDTDGDWEITAQATTIGDKHSESFSDSWTLDTLEPMISADLEPHMGEAGQYFNTVRTATLTIDERNFSPEDTSVVVSAETPEGTAVPAPSGSGWVEVDEYQWAQTLTFADELVFEVAIDTIDLAGNTTDTYEVPEFIVDLTAPEVEITQVADSTAYAGVVAPEVEVSDIHLSPGEVEYTLEGFNQGTVDSSTHFVTEDFDETTWSAVWEDFPREIEVDDIYTLSVTATDMAGNTTSDTVTFSVNRFGSTYMFSDGTKNLRGQYLKEPIDVEITEINVSGLNPELTEVSVVENDRVQPLADDDYELQDASVEGGWQATQYTLPAELFDASAYFRIMVSSVDEAGNLSQNTMDNKASDRNSSAEVKFAVDQVAPDVVVSGIESDGVYYSPVKNLIPDAKDNLALESVTMTVDGQTVLEASGSEALTDILAHELPADAQEHTVVVSATDKAGNVSKATYANVFVAASFWQYLASQPLLATALVGGGLVLLAALVIGTIALIRRRRRLAYRRNPFGL